MANKRLQTIDCKGSGLMEVPLWSFNFMYVVSEYLYQPAPDPGLLLTLGIDSRGA